MDSQSLVWLLLYKVWVESKQFQQKGQPSAEQIQSNGPYV